MEAGGWDNGMAKPNVKFRECDLAEEEPDLEEGETVMFYARD